MRMDQSSDNVARYSNEDCAKDAGPIGMTPNARASYPGAEHDVVEHNMTNHAPRSSYTVEKFESLRRAAKLFAHTLVDVCPDTSERSLALTNAEQALMWGVASIARTQ